MRISSFRISAVAGVSGDRRILRSRTMNLFTWTVLRWIGSFGTETVATACSLRLSTKKCGRKGCQWVRFDDGPPGGSITTRRHYGNCARVSSHRATRSSRAFSTKILEQRMVVL